MTRPITYRTEAEAEAVLKRTGYGKNATAWQSPHNEQIAEIRSDDARSYFWIEYKPQNYRFTG